MQITNSLVCGASNGCIYKQIKLPLVGEHAFPLTVFVCKEVHVTVASFFFTPEMCVFFIFLKQSSALVLV